MKIKRIGIVLGAVISAGLLVPPARAQDIPDAPAPATQPTVTRVNIHMKNALPEDVFDELSKQGRVHFFPSSTRMFEQDAMQTGMDIDLTNRPFWPAVQEICSMYNISLQADEVGKTREVQVLISGGANARWDKVPSCESQGFLIQAVSFNRDQSINYAVPAKGHNRCSVELVVFVDPSLRLSGTNVTCKAEQAVDDLGNNMLPDLAPSITFKTVYHPRDMIVSCNVPLKYPDSPGTKIAHLKGMLQLRGSDKYDTMTIDKPLEAAETTKAFGDAVLTFHSLKKASGGNYELSASISREGDSNTNDDIGLLQSAHLVNEKGTTFATPNGGDGKYIQGTFECVLRYLPVAGQEEAVPAQWYIAVPTHPRMFRIPVEFTDLPMR